MRHATWNAILAIAGPQASEKCNSLMISRVRACDWRALGDDESHFKDVEAALLVGGYSADLPTCPTCAVFVDMALAMRPT